MSDLRPSSVDIKVSIDLLMAHSVPAKLDADEFMAFVRLVGYCATDMVWTYTPPGSGWIEFDDRIHKLTNLSRTRFDAAWKNIKHLFYERDGKITPKEQWFTIANSGDLRPPIPASVRSFVMQRDAFRCVYCGSEKGPFDLDHVIPYSRGGSNADPENLVCSCTTCNRTKKARTPEEWLAKTELP